MRNIILRPVGGFVFAAAAAAAAVVRQRETCVCSNFTSHVLA